MAKGKPRIRNPEKPPVMMPRFQLVKKRKDLFFTSVISNYDPSMFTRGDSSGPHVHTAMSGLAPKGLGSGSPGERAGGNLALQPWGTVFLVWQGPLRLGRGRP